LFFAQALRRRSGANSEAGRRAAEGRMPGVKKSYPLARRASGSFAIQGTKAKSWIPAFAGMTSNRNTIPTQPSP
ncbi:MAG TPA: hypothetical protein VFL07_12845, partial [Rudaea sp.]|nr:hypothetical protein [Rudaea sp.]